MICCCWWISVLQGHLGTGREPKEKLFVLCDDDLLLQTDVRPSNKLMDRCRREREIVSTLRWWSVAADGSPSFKDISGQVENRRRNCFNFAMMICRLWCLYFGLVICFGNEMPLRIRHSTCIQRVCTINILSWLLEIWNWTNIWQKLSLNTSHKTSASIIP